MESPVSKLVQRPFSTRTHAEQVSILKEGPSRPCLHQSTDTGDDGSKRCKPFDDRLYEEHPWLTACQTLNRCFCWPCLLFNADDYTWSRKGFSDWESFPESLHDHEVTVEHIDADVRLKVFYHKHVRCADDLQGASGDAERSRTRTRDALEALVDVVLDEVVLEPVLLKKPDDPGRAWRFLDLLKSSREFASCGVASRELARGLIEQSPGVVDDVMRATAEVLKSEVKREAGQASHVSVILGEHSDVAGDRLMSTVLRYVRGSEACERFVGFTDSVERTADDTTLHILDVLEEYGVAEDKLVAYAVDGRVLGATEFSLLHRLMRDRFPMSFFTPWHCHRFGDLLLQSLTEIPEVEGFAKAMASLRLCFRKDSLPQTALDNFLDKSVLRNTRFVAESLWCDRNDVVNATLQHRKSMVEFLELVVRHPGMFAAEDVARAYGFRRYLSQFRTVFLLCLFSMISNVGPYFSTVCKCTKRYLESSWPVTFLKDLRKLRGTAFGHVWAKATKEMPHRPGAGPPSDEFRALFELVIDKLTAQLQLRLESHVRLRFNLLFLRSNWRSDVYTKSSLYWQLMKLLGPFVHSTEVLHNEIQVVNQSEPGCPNYSLNALFEALVKLGVAEAVPNLFKVVAMSYTMPLHANYNVSRYNKYDAIQEWSFCGDDETDRARAVLSLEVELLRRLKNDPNLKERVLEKLEEG